MSTRSLLRLPCVLLASCSGVEVFPTMMIHYRNGKQELLDKKYFQVENVEITMKIARFYVGKMEMDTAEINYIVLHIETPNKSWWIFMFCSISQFRFEVLWQKQIANIMNETWCTSQSSEESVLRFARHWNRNWCDDKRCFDNSIARQSWTNTKSILIRIFIFFDSDRDL